MSSDIMRRESMDAVALKSFAIEGPASDLEWWHSLTDAERETWADRVGRTYRYPAPGGNELARQRRESDIAAAAFTMNIEETEHA